jgi:hypothetical protein
VNKKRPGKMIAFVARKQRLGILSGLILQKSVCKVDDGERHGEGVAVGGG